MVADLTHTGHPFCGGDLEGIGGPTKPSRQQQDTIMCAKLGP